MIRLEQRFSRQRRCGCPVVDVGRRAAVYVILQIGDSVGIIDVFINLLKAPRGFIAGWIIALGPVWVYTPRFLIVFVETGLVFFPFLPGDSLLFAAGVFSADGGGLNVWATLIVFWAAAILGNTSNYWIARLFGSRIIDSGKVKALTPERMAKLDHFFERYGGLTSIITRGLPFFRTFAPFIAGTGHMNFGKFTFFNAVGGISWVSLFVLVGYFFGGIPLVQERRHSDTPMCANVDMYSGLVYTMLGIPEDVFTPLFASARIAGWCANRMEEVITCHRIMRPAYRAVTIKGHYVPIEERTAKLVSPEA